MFTDVSTRNTDAKECDPVTEVFLTHLCYYWRE